MVCLNQRETEAKKVSEAWGCAAPGALLVGLIALIAVALIAIGPVPTTLPPTPTPVATLTPRPEVGGCFPGRVNCANPLPLRQAPAPP